MVISCALDDDAQEMGKLLAGVLPTLLRGIIRQKDACVGSQLRQAGQEYGVALLFVHPVIQIFHLQVGYHCKFIFHGLLDGNDCLRIREIDNCT